MDDQQVTKLQFLDKVHTALFEAGHREHRVFLLYNLFSWIVIFLSTGTITVDRQFAFAGLVVSAPVSWLLVGVAVVIALLQYYDAALASYLKRLHKEMLDVYQSLGFTPSTRLLEPRWSALEYPDAGTVIFTAVEQTMLTPFVITPFTSSLPNIIKTKKAPRFLVARLLLSGMGALLVLAYLVGLPVIAEFLAIRTAVLHQGVNWPILLAILLTVALDFAAWFTAGYAVPGSFQQALQLMLDLVQPALQEVTEGRNPDTSPDTPSSTSPEMPPDTNEP